MKPGMCHKTEWHFPHLLHLGQYIWYLQLLQWSRKYCKPAFTICRLLSPSPSGHGTEPKPQQSCCRWRGAVVPGSLWPVKPSGKRCARSLWGLKGHFKTFEACQVPGYKKQNYSLCLVNQAKALLQPNTVRGRNSGRQRQMGRKKSQVSPFEINWYRTAAGLNYGVSCYGELQLSNLLIEDTGIFDRDLLGWFALTKLRVMASHELTKAGE